MRNVVLRVIDTYTDENGRPKLANGRPLQNYTSVLYQRMIYLPGQDLPAMTEEEAAAELANINGGGHLGIPPKIERKTDFLRRESRRSQIVDSSGAAEAFARLSDENNASMAQAAKLRAQIEARDLELRRSAELRAEVERAAAEQEIARKNTEEELRRAAAAKDAEIEALRAQLAAMQTPAAPAAEAPAAAPAEGPRKGRRDS